MEKRTERISDISSIQTLNDADNHVMYYMLHATYKYGEMTFGVTHWLVFDDAGEGISLRLKLL